MPTLLRSVSLTPTDSTDVLTSRWAWEAEAQPAVRAPASHSAWSSRRWKCNSSPGTAGEVSATPRRLHSRGHMEIPSVVFLTTPFSLCFRTKEASHPPSLTRG